MQNVLSTGFKVIIFFGNLRLVFNSDRVYSARPVRLFTQMDPNKPRWTRKYNDEAIINDSFFITYRICPLKKNL